MLKNLSNTAFSRPAREMESYPRLLREIETLRYIELSLKASILGLRPASDINHNTAADVARLCYLPCSLTIMIQTS